MEEKSKKLNLSTLSVLIVFVLIILIIGIAFYFNKGDEINSNNVVQNNNQTTNENVLLEDNNYVYSTLEEQVEALAGWYVGAINNQNWEVIEEYDNSSNLYNDSTIVDILKEYEITNYSITSEINHWEPEGVESNQSVYFYYVSYDIENTEIESAKDVGLGKMLVINLTKLDSGDIEFSITPFATGI